MKSDGPLKVLIVDDHDIVRKGLAMLISRQEDILVAGEAGTKISSGRSVSGGH